MNVSSLRQIEHQHLGGTPINFLSASIDSIQGKGFVVALDQQPVYANLASSCLIQPSVGDLVMLANTNDEYFITGILRTSSSNHAIQVDGNLTLKASSGDLTFQSDKNLTLSSTQAISNLSRSHETLTDHYNVAATKLDVTSQNSTMNLDKVQVNASMASVVIDDLYQRFRQVVKWVQNMETAKIGTWIQQVKQHMSIRSKNMAITAEDDVRIDGERIHMG